MRHLERTRTALSVSALVVVALSFGCYDGVSTGTAGGSHNADAATGGDAASAHDAATQGDTAVDDAGVDDVGADDAGALDAGFSDAADPVDAGSGVDAADTDAETSDAGIPDAGDAPDAGPVSPVGALGPQINIYDGRNPDIATDSKSDPHIVFDRKGGGVFFAKGSGTGGQFPASPVQIGKAGAIEPRIFIDESDDVHVVWAHSPSGGNVGGTEGWYTNNIGGSWRAPLKVAVVGDGDTGDGGLTRVSCGRVVRVPGEDLAVTAWMGKGPNVLVSVEGLASSPAVRKKVRATNFPIGLVALSSTAVRTIYRPLPGAMEATDYDLDLNPVKKFDVVKGPLKGECADGFLDRKTGVVHYTGTPVGNSLTPSRLWYTNDERIAQNRPVYGMVVAEMGGTQYFWADVCVDVRGQAYVTHSYIDTEPECTNRCDAYVAYVENEQLVSVLMAPGYQAMRVGPFCAPTSTGGIHVVYHLAGKVYYRTVGVP